MLGRPSKLNALEAPPGVRDVDMLMFVFASSFQVHTMVRQMLGAANEFVAAAARERLAHGRATALQAVAQDPHGARSYQGKPKLGGASGHMEHDARLFEKMKAYADMPASKRPSLADIAVALKGANKQWSVRKGANKGKPWAEKQIHVFLQRFGAGQRKAAKGTESVSDKKQKGCRVKGRGRAPKSSPVHASRVRRASSTSTARRTSRASTPTRKRPRADGPILPVARR